MSGPALDLHWREHERAKMDTSRGPDRVGGRGDPVCGVLGNHRGRGTRIGHERSGQPRRRRRQRRPGRGRAPRRRRARRGAAGGGGVPGCRHGAGPVLQRDGGDRVRRGGGGRLWGPRRAVSGGALPPGRQRRRDRDRPRDRADVAAGSRREDDPRRGQGRRRRLRARRPRRLAAAHHKGAVLVDRLPRRNRPVCPDRDPLPGRDGVRLSVRRREHRRPLHRRAVRHQHRVHQHHDEQRADPVRG